VRSVIKRFILSQNFEVDYSRKIVKRAAAHSGELPMTVKSFSAGKFGDQKQE